MTSSYRSCWTEHSYDMSWKSAEDYRTCGRGIPAGLTTKQNKNPGLIGLTFCLNLSVKSWMEEDKEIFRLNPDRKLILSTRILKQKLQNLKIMYLPILNYNTRPLYTIFEMQLYITWVGGVFATIKARGKLFMFNVPLFWSKFQVANGQYFAFLNVQSVELACLTSRHPFSPRGLTNKYII